MKAKSTCRTCCGHEQYNLEVTVNQRRPLVLLLLISTEAFLAETRKRLWNLPHHLTIFLFTWLLEAVQCDVPICNYLITCLLPFKYQTVCSFIRCDLLQLLVSLTEDVLTAYNSTIQGMLWKLCKVKSCLKNGIMSVFCEFLQYIG